MSRQFVEISRVRIEGLLAAFPKLMHGDKQHTFIETESIRYVYQPLKTMFLVLITNKTSNILEDLDTLQMLAKIIPDYCRVISESEILSKAFELIFAFDEVLALGYKEKVSLQQIRTYLAMESHEEKVHEMVKRNKEREAREEADRKRNVIEASRLDPHSHAGNMWPESMPERVVVAESHTIVKSKPQEPVAAGMKLQKKTQTSSQFMAQMMDEGDIDTVEQSSHAVEEDIAEAVQVKVEERVAIQLTSDSTLKQFTVKGTLQLLVLSSEFNQVSLRMGDVSQAKKYKFRTHPSIDKAGFEREGLLALKGNNKAYAVGSSLAVGKWTYSSEDEGDLPLLVNCWPTANRGGTSVSIEYELTKEDLTLDQVVVAVPIHGLVPVVGEMVGQYMVEKRSQQLLWRLDRIDAENSAGSMEFTLPAELDAERFFPIQVTFQSANTYCGFGVEGVSNPDGTPAEYHYSATLLVDDYTVG